MGQSHPNYSMPSLREYELGRTTLNSFQKWRQFSSISFVFCNGFFIKLHQLLNYHAGLLSFSNFELQKNAPLISKHKSNNYVKLPCGTHSSIQVPFGGFLLIRSGIQTKFWNDSIVFVHYNIWSELRIYDSVRLPLKAFGSKQYA